MRISQKIAVAVVSLFAAGAAAMAASPTPAMAAMQGPAGYISFWDGCSGGSNPTVGYCGAAWPIPPQATGTCHSVPSGANDRFSAFSNNTTHNIRVWTNASCGAGGGSSAVLYAKTETGQIGSGFNNTITSYVWIS